MLTIDDKIRKPLTELGVTRREQVLQLFSELRTSFDAAAFTAKSDPTGSHLGNLRAKWLDSLDGILATVRGAWVMQAPSEVKRTAEIALDHLQTHVKVGLKALQTLDQLGIKDPRQVTSLFQELRNTFQKDVALDLDEADLEITRINWLGRKTGILTWIGDNWVKPTRPELKRDVGQSFNSLKAFVEKTLLERREEMAAAAWAGTQQSGAGTVAAVTGHYQEKSTAHAAVAATSGEVGPIYVPEALSLPGVERPIGTRHLIQQTFDEIQGIFLSLGYTVVEGPEIETPYYNFEALNIPEHHPVRDTMDTFYLETPTGAPRHLLRTHTSPMQVRTMEKQPPPARIIVPGKCYRRDNPDATHSFMFHQVEGLAVDSDITFCDFKGTVEYFVTQFFGAKVRTRLRPSYFPFTEPSAEVDATCHVCAGSGCRICKFAGWIELFGAGMVDPAVYGFVNYDAKRLSGFAFGLGVDRLAMLKYGVNDLQLFFQNDVRFLRQFP